MNTNLNSRPLKSRGFTRRTMFFTLAAFALFAATAATAFMAAGSVFTTDDSCVQVNGNVTYPNKQAVYVRGHNMPEGNYGVRVTEPDGTLLGESFNSLPVHADENGDFAACYQLWSIVQQEEGGGPGYHDSGNGGDEYKVSVCKDGDFSSSNCKSDNFKVKQGPPPPPQNGGLQILKFYDADMDGVRDFAEVDLPNWQFDLSPAIGSNPQITPFFSVAAPGLYTATERDTIETNWFASTPKSLNATVVLNDTSVIEFGNYCTLTPGGHTIGFWSNKNGQNLEDAADFTELSGLCLVNEDGSDRNFAGTLIVNKKNLNIWLLDAKAKNMAYMLSAQLAATELSVNHGVTNPSIIVDGANDVTALMAYANLLLCADGYTPGGDINRAEQERVKDILDKINNGGSFVQPTAANCPYHFLQQ